MAAPRQQQWTWKLFLLMLPVPVSPLCHCLDNNKEEYLEC